MTKMSQKSNQRYRCQICEVFYDSSSEKVFMAYFPRNVARCKVWVKITGKKDLISLPIEKLTRKRICYLHFTSEDFNTNKRQLKRNAIPSKYLTRPPLPDKLLKNFGQNFECFRKGKNKSFAYGTETELTKKILSYEKVVQHIQHDHKYFLVGPPKKYDFLTPDEELSTTTILGEDLIDNNSDRNGFACTNVEYLEDAVSDCANDADDIYKNEEQYLYSEQDETFEKDITLSLDYIDYLFLSYAQSFRLLSKHFQTMLKLDIAKLFARYEMKNISLVSQEPEIPPPITTTTDVQTEHISEPLVIKSPPQAEKPLPAVAKPLDEHVFIPSRDENKTKRIPTQEVVSSRHKPEHTQSSHKVTQSTQDVTKKPSQITQMPSHVKRYSPRVVSSKRNLTIQKNQSTLSKGLEMKTTNVFQSFTTNFDPTVKLEKLKTDILISESTPSIPPKMIKYFVPKEGPAYAVINKEELVKTEEDAEEPDLEMEVSEPVFVSTNPFSFSEDET